VKWRVEAASAALPRQVVVWLRTCAAVGYLKSALIITSPNMDLSGLLGMRSQDMDARQPACKQPREPAKPI
jgi:hypothetical protein